MKHMSVRKTLIAAALVGATAVGAVAFANSGASFGPGPGADYYGMGPGMMSGPGSGYGMGPGMMQGYGPGYNISGNHERTLNDTAAQAFSTNCSQCHALPDPAQHTAQEWPPIVARMEQYERAQGRLAPDATTTEAIIAFLHGHGR